MQKSYVASISMAALVIAIGAFASAQEPVVVQGSQITNLVKIDLTGVPNKQVIANIYDVPAGAMVPLHFHHGDEFHLVLSGEWAAEVQGKPIHPMKAGDSQFVEREHSHGGKVVGNAPMKLLGLMIVDKDKPLTEIVGR